MLHPDTSLPPDVLAGAYADLVAAIARHEPEALRRAAAAMDDDAHALPGAFPDGSPGARLARGWLAFTGNHEPATPSAGAEVYTFSYPAHVVFEMLGTAGAAAARRRAARAIGALLGTDVPLGGVAGALPADPSILNLTVWAGSVSQAGDRLDLELAE